MPKPSSRDEARPIRGRKRRRDASHFREKLDRVGATTNCSHGVRNFSASTPNVSVQHQTTEDPSGAIRDASFGPRHVLSSAMRLIPIPVKRPRSHLDARTSGRSVGTAAIT
ncbi:hypothetical protein [Sphingomonas sp. PP-CE-1G-424]|uniref:hypothetical protein n=1 Tax=Sphingomonas sp. PP-CE-1G-424 TaxID=2135658 RepID=UPI0010546C1E|nr:hypothetical protein [Sphingomonas sp. PP-CE-1G-424]